jgi:uncharacterized protein (DUF885 family)
MAKRFLSIFLFVLILLTSCLNSSPLSPVNETEVVLFTQTPTSTDAAVLPELTPISSAEKHYGVVRTPTRIDEMVADLQGLSLEEFFDRSFLLWISRDPETMTKYGLSEKLGLRNNQLTNISQGYIEDTQKLERAIYEVLMTYNRDEMTLDQMLNYDIYSWFWKDKIEGQQYQLLTYPLHSYPYTSFEQQFVKLLVVYHPLENREDVEDYLSRLEQIDLQVDDLLVGLKIRENMGVIPPRMVLVDVINQIRSYLELSKPGISRPEDVILYQSFKSRLSKIETLSESEKIEYLKQVLSLIETDFIPSYIKLADYLTQLMEVANDDAGVWKLPDGENYYNYLIRHYTSQDLTAEQIYSLGEIYSETDRTNLIEFARKNNLISPDSSIQKIGSEIFNTDRVIKFSISDQENPIFAQFDDIYSDSQSAFFANFGSTPDNKLLEALYKDYQTNFSIIHYEPDPWLNISAQPLYSQKSIPEANLRTMFYAEVIPGTLYQQSFLDKNTSFPLFRKYLRFSGYIEGWSCYAPQIMMEKDAYFDHPDEIMVTLQRDLFLSASLVVDSGIHQQGWSLTEGSIYLENQTGIPRVKVRDTVNRFAVNPGQVLAYKIGYEKFMELRDYAKQSLGVRFSLVDYHEWLMGQGNMPLSILEEQVKAYVLQKNKTNDPNFIP